METELAPSDARRLSRLRVLLSDARRRGRDESELGLHRAVVAIDGIGELTIGLCMQHRGVSVKQRVGVPGRLEALIKELAITPPGKKGFLELHRARNSVQHEGILPAPEQVPLWLAETEQLIDALVKATFGVALDEIRSAAGVADPDLRCALEKAESALEDGDAEHSFEASWEALELARRLFRKKSGLHHVAPLIGNSALSLIKQDRDLSSLTREVRNLADQVEISAFTAEPGEWLWFKQRHGEIFRGLSPSRSDAGRAFVFTLSWILWYESYISRHGIDRWERLREEQCAPVTGIPGGPHIRDVSLGNSPSAEGGRIEGLQNWIFQLTDVPETQPPFDWAVHDVVSELDEAPLTNAWMDGYGRLSISCPQAMDPKSVKAAVQELLAGAKAKLARREIEDAEDDQVREEITARFRTGLERAGCPVVELGVSMPRDQHRIKPEQASVRIVLPEPEGGGPSWFSRGCEETFELHFPEAATPASYRSDWNDISVPAVWDPERVGHWVCDAIAFDEEKRSAEVERRRRAAAAEAEALEEMRRLIKAD